MKRFLVEKSLIGAAVGATALTSVIAFTLPRNFSVGNFVDDAHYVVLAKSIRQHATYRTLNIPDRPPETKYPPGFPLLLASVWSPDRSDVENLNRMRFVNLALIGPAAGLLTIVGATVLQMHPITAAGLAVAGVTAPGVVTLWTVPLSGTLFLLLVSVALAIFPRCPPGWRIVMFGFAVYVRTIAIAFAVPVLAVAWLRKDKTWLKDAVVLSGMLLPWGLWQLIHRDAVADELLGLFGSYGQWYVQSLLEEPFTVLIRVPIINGRESLVALGTHLLGGDWLPRVILGVFGLVIVWRVWRAKTRNTILMTGIAMYGVVVLLWPFPPDRFIAATWPLILLTTGASFGKHARLLAAAAVVVSSVTLMRGDAIASHRDRSETVAELVTHTDEIISGDDVIASTNAALYYLRYGVPSVPVQRMRTYRWYRLGFWSTAWGTADDVLPLLERYNATRVLVEARGVEGRFAVGSLINRCPDMLEEVWEGAAGLVFVVNSEAVCELN